MQQQGIEICGVTPSSKNSEEWFFINNWTVDKENTVPIYNDGSNNYYYVNSTHKYKVGENTGDIYPEIRIAGSRYEFFESEVNDVVGISGQGNNNPYSNFGNHQLLEIDGKIYDPSYGKTYLTLEDWENNAIFGYYKCVKLPYSEIEDNIDVNKDGVISVFNLVKIFIRKNPK